LSKQEKNVVLSAKEYSMIDIAPTVSAILQLHAPAQAKGAPIQDIVTALSGLSKVVILAPDALGMFAWNLWRAEMPYLNSLHTQNSITLHSVMPSITPVNFATMVTGTDLAGHAVHTFKDNFACETLFDVVRKANGKSAGVGLAGYTGCELLGRFADIWGNAGDGSDDAVADMVIEIADSAGPEFLIAQFGRVDDVFHKYGPSSSSVVPMLKATDARLKRLVEHLRPLGYGIVILADHGQHDVVEPSMKGLKGSHGTDMPEDCLVPCTWI
jgi:predicted AlkP superfamily pyrophosphatase or phosphodiesterase